MAILGCVSGFIAPVILVVAIEAIVPRRPNISRRFYTLATAHGLLLALSEFDRDHQRFPSEAEGLATLVPQYADNLRPDAWGKPFVYVPPAPGEQPGASSYGADGDRAEQATTQISAPRLAPCGRQ